MRRLNQEQSAVEWELKTWGYHLGVQFAAEGYSPSNTIAQILSGRGSRVGHKILCRDPPARFWEYNRNVLRLKRELYEVLVARYAVPCRYDTGEPYRATELAGFLGVTPEVYLDRLGKARAGYRRLIFPEPAFEQYLALRIASV
jgi:hypothetical protein